MNADGTNAVRLTRSEGGNGHASFSADGSRIYFTSGRGGNQDVWVMNADGTEPAAGSRPRPGPMARPRSLPMGGVTFYTERDGNPELYAMNPDGTNLRNLTQSPDTRLRIGLVARRIEGSRSTRRGAAGSSSTP